LPDPSVARASSPPCTRAHICARTLLATVPARACPGRETAQQGYFGRRAASKPDASERGPLHGPGRDSRKARLSVQLVRARFPEVEEKVKE
jgi:hypothetical protein